MTTQNFLTRFSCNKEYVLYCDDGFWKVLVEISVFNVNRCFVCLLCLPLTSSKNV